MSSQDDVVPGDRVPTGDEPGADSTPADEGEGVVDIGDRTAGGSPAANQSKAEPMPPTAAHDDPDAASEPEAVEVPDLGSMNVGAADPQAPSHPAAGPAGDRADAGLPDLGTTPLPAVGGEPTTGSAFRAPGSLGVEGDDEEVETDLTTSAARTNVVGAAGAPSGPGDPSSVPAGSDDASPGTSQESSVVEGSRSPQ